MPSEITTRADTGNAAGVLRVLRVFRVAYLIPLFR